MKFYLLICGLFLIVFACKKEETKIVPTLATTSTPTVSGTTVTLTGNIIADGGSIVTARGFCWSTNSNPSVSDNKSSEGTGVGSFSSIITGLLPNQTYYFKSYATNSIGTAYGVQISVTTQAIQATLVTTPTPTVTATTVTLNGNISNDGGSTITARGFCWSTNAAPTISDNKSTEGSGAGSFSSTVTGLTPGQTYYFRSYATNSMGTSYGEAVNVTIQAVLAILATTPPPNVSGITVTLNGNITGDGGSAITARGFCWSTNTAPTISDSKSSEGTGAGNFSSIVTGLTPSQTYYFRSYATNSIGTSYGVQVSVTTQAIKATLAITPAPAVTATTVTLSGSITSDGGAAISARGFCWSTTSPVTILNSKSSEGTGIGSFSSTITGLASGQTYYFSSYATNSAGISYGNQLTVKTLAGLPTISTSDVGVPEPVTMSSMNASCGGNVTSDGGATVTARGVCWSTSPNPTTANSKTSDLGSTGIFNSILNGLTPGLTYYVKAYATNSIGTAYGNEVSKLMIILPTLSTDPISYVMITKAKCGGSISNDSGGLEITARGVCWSTSQNPTIANTKTVDGTNSGKFTSSIAGLAENTTYYLRAYATNSWGGTGYGNSISFTTFSKKGPTVTDVEGNVYQTVRIEYDFALSLYMAENLKTTKYNDGTPIVNEPSASLWNNLTSGAYCWYNNDVNNKNIYGALYNWYAVNTEKLCPTGWTVDTFYGWRSFRDAIVTSGKIKEQGTSHWTSPNTGATNETGFTALPGGYRARTYGSDFSGLGTSASFWSSQGKTMNTAYYMEVDKFYENYFFIESCYMAAGMSVRCTK